MMDETTKSKIPGAKDYRFDTQRGIDFDEEQKRQEVLRTEADRVRIESSPTLLDDELHPKVVAYRGENAKTILVDRTEAAKQRKDLRASMAIGGAGREKGAPTVIREGDRLSEAPTLELPSIPRRDEESLSEPQPVYGKPKTFGENLADIGSRLVDVGSRFVTAILGEPKVKRVPAEKLSLGSAPIQRTDVPSRLKGPDQTQFFNNLEEVQAYNQALQETEDREEAQKMDEIKTGEVRQWLLDSGLMYETGELTDDIRLDPEQQRFQGKAIDGVLYQRILKAAELQKETAFGSGKKVG